MEQLRFLSGGTPFKIDKPIRLIELFAGIGAQAKALERMGVPFEHYRICEFDKYAVASYNAIHGTDFAPSDITKIAAGDLGIVDTDTYCYIMTYSFPCQDLSLAGKQEGMARGGGTRSGLLWEVERLLNECTELPQVLLMENVTQVHGKKNKEHFDEWIRFLEGKGYRNYWQDLNAKDFGVPQSRNRTFMVSVLGDYTYHFPDGHPLTKRLKDVLEDSVDGRYYLSDKMINYFATLSAKNKANGNGNVYAPSNPEGVSKTITTKEGTRVKDNFIQYYVSEKGTKFILSPKRGMCTDVNADIAQPLTANGQANWTGSFISPDIESVEKSTVVGSIKPVKITLKNGDTVYFDGENFAAAANEGLPCSTRGKQIASAIRASIHKQGSRNLIQNYENGLGYEGVIEFVAYDEQNGYIREDGTVGTLTTDGSSPKHNNRIIEVWDGYNQRVRAEKGTVGALTQNCGKDLKRNGQGIITYEPSVIGGIGEKKSNGGTQWYQQDRIYDGERVGISVATGFNPYYTTSDLRIRKLTPKECFRLMGFTDEDFEKAEAVNSNTQLYKQAGNSIVVDVLMAIFRNLF